MGANIINLCYNVLTYNVNLIETDPDLAKLIQIQPNLSRSRQTDPYLAELIQI